jgi:hypothetical protein
MIYKYLLTAVACFCLARGNLSAQFVGGDGGGFAVLKVNNPRGCLVFEGGSNSGDGYGFGTTTTNCVMHSGAGNNDGYGFGTSATSCVMHSGAGNNDGYSVGISPAVCIMRSGAGFEDGYGVGLSPEVCFFIGGDNDGYTSATGLTDDFCEVTKTRLFSQPCGVRDNGKYCNAFTGEQAAAGEPAGNIWSIDGIQNTLWFEFYPPSSGTFSIETINTDSTFDTQIAVYQVDALTHCPACQISSAESGGIGNNARIVLSCLDPNQLYYLQLDGNLGSTGKTAIRITDICPPPPYSGTDECDNNVVSQHNTYNLCLTPNTTGASDPDAASLTNIGNSSTSICGQNLDLNLENSTFLPVQFNSNALQIDVSLNQSLCNRGFSVMVFQAPSLLCPSSAQWGDAAHPLVGCFEGNGLGNVVQLDSLNPNTVYYILVDGVRGDGGLIQLDISPILPLTWLTFEGERIEQKHHLYWETGTEQNTAYFDIERSSDALNFEKIGNTAAAGNSSLPLGYMFIDSNPLIGHNYYRIKQVDNDQHFDYSRIIVLDNFSDGKLDFNIYPNPATEQITLYSQSQLVGNTCYFELYDVLGRLLMQQSIANLRQQSQDISVAHLLAGAYFIHIKNEENQVIYRHKLIKKDR